MALDQIDRPSSQRQVIQVLMILGSAVLLGCLLVVGMIYAWGPSGSYAISDVLLAPETLSQLGYRDQGTDKWVFDRIEFRTGEGKSVPVTVEAYQRFYATIVKDRSVAASHAPFETGRLDRLIVWVRPQQGQERRPFQEVEIPLQGDRFRVEMYGSPNREWVDFEHPEIGHLARQIFL